MEGSSYEIFDKAIKMVIKKYSGRPFYDDLYQDCYMKILEVLKNNSYEPILNLFGYAYRIARNQVTHYLYHKNKLTTLKDDALFDSISSNDDPMEFNCELEEIALDVIEQFSNVLTPEFTPNDLLKLIYMKDSEISHLKYRIIKGEFLWRVSRNH